MKDKITKVLLIGLGITTIWFLYMVMEYKEEFKILFGLWV